MIKSINDLVRRYSDAVEHRAEMGHYTVAAIVMVFGFLVVIIGFFGILWGILALFGTKVYIALFVVGAVWYARRNLMRQFPQDEDENETGVS